MVSSILRPRDFLPSDTHAHTIAGTVKMVILLMIRSYVTTDCKTGRSSWSSHMNLLKAGFPTQLWGRRYMPPPHPQDKVVGDLSPAEQYPKTRMAGQLREESGPCRGRAKRPPISHSQSPATSPTTCAQKAPWRSKGECGPMMPSYSQASLVESTLAKEMCAHVGGFWDIRYGRWSR